MKDEIFSVLQYLGKLLNGVGVGVVHLKNVKSKEKCVKIISTQTMFSLHV